MSKKPGDESKKKPEDPGTLSPGRGADFHKPEPGDELPMSSLPFQPAGGEQFGTLQAGSDFAPPEGLQVPPTEPDSGEAQTPPTSGTRTVSSDSSVIQPILRTLGAPGVTDPTTESVRQTLAGFTGTAAEAMTNTADLHAVLNIRRHIVEGQLSGIVPVDTPGEAPAALVVDEKRPEYEVLSELARGGMGVVYTAIQTSLNRRLALKTLKPGSGTTKNEEGDTEQASSWQEDRRLRDMFVSEAVVTANLVHPNIVPVHDLGQTDDGKLFYSMKKVEGTPWHHSIMEMTVEENLDILLKVSDAVAFAHFNGVINRDLKPENVAIGRFGEVAVLDWGLAVTTPAFKQRDSVLIHSEGFGGSPGYMAPEQVRGVITDIGYHTDIYLLGAILYQVITGRAPHQFVEFEALPQMEAISATLTAALDNRIEETDKQGELLDIAMTAMATDPADRYPTVEAFQDAIREYRITGRADELLRVAPGREREQGYADYQAAVALYDEAARKWPENERAARGLREARLQYARLAHQRGDYDLGLQVLGDSQDSDFVSARRRLLKARRMRSVMKWTWGFTTVAAIVGFIFAGVQWRQATLAEKETKATLTRLEEATGNLKKVQADVEAKKAEVADAEEKLAEAQLKEMEASRRLAEAEQKLVEAETKTATAETKLQDAQTRLDDAQRKLAEADTKLQMAQASLLLAEQKRQQAEMQLASAQQKATQAELARAEAEFDAWETQLASASKAGDYATALEILNQMLADTNGDGAPDNQFVAQNQDVFTRLKLALTANVTRLDAGVNAAAVGTGGRALVVAGTDRAGHGKVCLWPLKAGEKVGGKPVAEVHTDGVANVVAVTGDARLFAAASASGVQVWTSDGMALGPVLPRTDGASTLRFSESGRRLIVGTVDGTVQVYDVSETPVRLLGRRNLGDYRVSDVQWLSDTDSEGSLLVVLTGTRQALCGSVSFTTASDGQLELPGRRSDGSASKWAQLEFPADYRPRLAHMFVSPGAGYLAVTNQDDGDILLFPRRQGDALDRFPFLTAFEMDQAGRKYRWQDCHVGTVTQVAFSADGRRVVSAADDSRMRVWDLEPSGRLVPAFENEFRTAGKPLREENQLKGHADAIVSCGFLGGSSTTVVSTSLDRTVRTWDLGTYAAVRESILKAGSQMARIRDSARSASLDSLRLVPAERAEGRAPAFFFTAFRPRPQRIRVASQGGKPRLNVIQGHVGGVSSVAFSPDAKLVVTAGQDQTARTWLTATGAPASENNIFSEGHDYNISSLQFLPDGRYLATTSFDGTLLIWDTEDDADGLGRELARLKGLGMSNSIAISADGSFILTSTVKPGDGGHQRYGAALWRTSDLISGGRPMPAAELLDVHEARVSAVAISPDAERLVTCDRLGKISVWSADGGILSANQVAHEDGISAMSFVTAREFVTAGFDGRIKLWRLLEDGSAEQDRERSFAMDQDYVWRLRVSPDGRQMLTSGFSQDRSGKNLTLTILVWDLATGRARQEPVYERPVEKSLAGAAYQHDIGWSPDGSRAIVAAAGELRFYDTAGWGPPVLRLREKSGRVEPASVVYSPVDDGTLATYDGRTVHLWHVAGAGPATEALHTGTLRSSARVAAAGFSADGRYIVTGSRSIRVFDASSAGARSVLRIEEPVNPSDKQPLIHGGVLTWVEFSPDPASHRFASSGLDGSAKIWDWDPANQRPVAARDLAHTPDVAVRQVRWSPDASLVVTAGDDGQVRVWDVADAQAPPTVMPLPDPDGAYRFLCCAFSPECEVLGATRWVAAGGIDLKRQSSVVVVWKLTDQGPRLHCVVPGKEHGNRGVTAVAFTPDGRLVTGGVRGALMMWEFLRPRVAADESPPQARPLFPIVRFGSRGRSTAHRGQVTSIAVAADGTMATSAADGALVWGF